MRELYGIGDSAFEAGISYSEMKRAEEITNPLPRDQRLEQVAQGGLAFPSVVLTTCCLNSFAI